MVPQLYNLATAPEESRSALKQAEEKFGFVPNLLGVLAGSPAALEAYTSIASAFERSDLTALEQQVVLLSASFQNRCDYCMAAHSVAAKLRGASDADVDALREGTSLQDPRLDALRRFTRSVVEQMGWVDDDEVERFRRAGFTAGQVLDVLVGVTQKTLSNYTNHLARTPLDEAFRKYAWKAPEETPASR